MNTWNLVKEKMVKDHRPGTMGYDIAVNNALDIFLCIQDNLKDITEAQAAISSDNDVMNALIHRQEIIELRKAGVLSE